MQNYTYQSIMTTAQKVNAHNTGIVGSVIPFIKLDYFEHLDILGLDQFEYENPRKYIKDVSYADKRKTFTDAGFKVTHMSLTHIKMHKHIKSLEDDFRNGKIDVIVLEIALGNGSLYFVLVSDPGETPLVNFVTTPEQLAKAIKKTEQARAFMNSKKGGFFIPED